MKKRSGFDWRIVVGLIVLVPLAAVIFGVVASVITDDNPVGKCIEYDEGIAASAGSSIGVVKIVSCSKFHTGKVIVKVADSEQCPAAVQERITAKLLGKFGTYCVQPGV